MFLLVRKKINSSIFSLNIEGVMLGKKNTLFEVSGNKVMNIRVCDRSLARSVVVVKVNSLYKKLLNVIADLLTEDDESGECYREALNQIERFRTIIKNKYRDYLLKEDLMSMSRKLVLLKKEANDRLLEIQYSRINEFKNDTNRRSR